MSDVIDLATVRQAKVEKDAVAERLWDEYLDAYRQAHESHAIEDGIRAGKIWAEWLDLFVRRAR